MAVADAEMQRLSQIARTSLKFFRQSTAPAQISVRDLIDSVLTVFQPRITRLGIRLRKHYADTPELLCFPGELQQVFTNLVSNSLDAMKEGGELSISVRPAWHATSPAVRRHPCDCDGFREWNGRAGPIETLRTIFHYQGRHRNWPGALGEQRYCRETRGQNPGAQLERERNSSFRAPATAWFAICGNRVSQLPPDFRVPSYCGSSRR